MIIEFMVNPNQMDKKIVITLLIVFDAQRGLRFRDKA